MSFGSGIRPRWRQLFQKGARPSVDFSVSPVHEVADDLEPDTPGGTPVADVLVTGITAEYSSSELVLTEGGDSIVVESI